MGIKNTDYFSLPSLAHPLSERDEWKAYERNAGLFNNQGLSRSLHGNKLLRHWKWVVGVSLVASAASAGYYFREEIYNNMNPVVMQEVATNTGQRKYVQLSDGTEVWLSPQSTLHYPETFNRDVREVTLTGEGFFKVKADAAHSFVVHSNKVKIQGPGSTFNVQAYENQPYTAVTSVNGAATISVADTQADVEPATIKANQCAIYVNDYQKIVTNNYSNADMHMQARRNGRYEFWGMPVTEVIKELQRQRSLSVELEGNYSTCKYYGEFRAQEPTEKILKRISEGINAKLTKEGENWVIHAKGCNKS
jgi:ferric-dicitrate binding protein FerR (iron transport regulator)